jgi:hypothetical protein
VSRQMGRTRSLEALISKQHSETINTCQTECWLLEMEINKMNSWAGLVGEKGEQQSGKAT